MNSDQNIKTSRVLTQRSNCSSCLKNTVDRMDSGKRVAMRWCRNVPKSLESCYAVCGADLIRALDRILRLSSI